MGFEQPPINTLDSEAKRQARNKDIDSRPGRKHAGWLEGAEWQEEEKRINANNPQRRQSQALQVEEIADIDMNNNKPTNNPENLSAINGTNKPRSKKQEIDEHRLDDNDGPIASAHFEPADKYYNTDKLIIAREKNKKIYQSTDDKITDTVLENIDQSLPSQEKISAPFDSHKRARRGRHPNKEQISQHSFLRRWKQFINRNKHTGV